MQIWSLNACWHFISLSIIDWLLGRVSEGWPVISYEITMLIVISSTKSLSCVTRITSTLCIICFIGSSCSVGKKTGMVHQTFVWWAVYIPYSHQTFGLSHRKCPMCPMFFAYTVLATVKNSCNILCMLWVIYYVVSFVVLYMIYHCK